MSVYVNGVCVKMNTLTRLAAVLLLVHSVYADCPSGFEQHDASCYKILGLEASWAEAKSYCRFLGTDLVIVDNAAEEAAIEGMLTRIHGSHLDEYYYISGSDMINEGQFMWLAGDGQRYPIDGYTNWASGQPDNSGGQDCLLIRYRGSKTSWVDGSCEAHHSFICEVSSDAGGTEVPAVG